MDVTNWWTYPQSLKAAILILLLGLAVSAGGWKQGWAIIFSAALILLMVATIVIPPKKGEHSKRVQTVTYFVALVLAWSAVFVASWFVHRVLP